MKRQHNIVIPFGSHVIDAHEQMVGTVIRADRHGFVMRQQLGLCQLVRVPNNLIAATLGPLVFLTVTCGEVELFCERLRESVPETRLWRRVGQSRHVEVMR